MPPQPGISIVVPVYNEEKCIDAFLDRITPILAGLEKTYEIIFINDGSHDKTLSILKDHAKSDCT